VRAVAVQPREEKDPGDLSSVYQIPDWVKGCKEDGARLSSVVPTGRTRGHGHEQGCRKFH